MARGEWLIVLVKNITISFSIIGYVCIHFIYCQIVFGAHRRVVGFSSAHSLKANDGVMGQASATSASGAFRPAQDVGD